MAGAGRRRSAPLALGIVVLASACAGAGTARPLAGPTVTPSGHGKREPLCQPFPDRLIDELLVAYEGHDVEALSDLVSAERVRDVTAVPHAGRSEFENVVEWAREGWEARDRLDLMGYGAFAPSHDGFTMYLVRGNDALRAAGIEELSLLLAAGTNGCEIDELRTVGPAQARSSPCAFYEAFGDHPAVAAEEPAGCLDGSAAYARYAHAAVWTGEEMLVLGGSRGGEFRVPDLWNSGLVYRPAGDEWSVTSPNPVTAAWQPRAVWTDRDVIVWGGGGTGAAAYDPDSDRWRSLPAWPLRRDEFPEGGWTGDELILWGSSQYTDRPTQGGAIYDPATNGWRLTADAPIQGREGHTAVWSGEELIVWGGTNYRTDLGDGAAYDPSIDAWRRIALSPLRPRTDHAAFWTGKEMLVWGGSSYSSAAASGAAYDPAGDSWRRLPEAPIEGRHGFAAVWTGDELIVWGGYDYRDPLNDGAAYDPKRDEWRMLPPAPISARCYHSAVWTGQEVVVFGGYDACGVGGHIPFGDGASYDPATDTWRPLAPA